MTIDFIFSIAILLMSVVIHEVSHGYAAFAFGDVTAKYAGRLTLNPFKHLDMTGSIFVPILTYLTGGVVFGWAKPVPYNPYNLKNARIAEPFVAAAGPLSNFIIAIVFGLLIRFGAGTDLLSSAFLDITKLLVTVNLVLGIFNLIPVPPLDGSKLLFAFLPQKFNEWRRMMEHNFLIVAIVAIFLLSPVISPIVTFLYSVITGMPY